MSKKRNYRLFLFGFLLADLIAAGVLSLEELKDRIPDTVYIRYGQEEGLGDSLDIPLITYPETIDVSDRGSYQIPCSLLGMLPLKNVQVETVEDQWVCVSGNPVGLYMETQGVLIVDTGEITNQNGIALEPAANIVQPGDYILEVNGKTVSRKRELIAEIEDCQGENVELVVNRKGEEIPLSLEPVLTQEENYKLGIWVRDNTQGIGTMTYVDEKGRFGALGHGISDTDTGELLDVSGGELYQAQIVSIIRGAQGVPGELSGYIEYEDEKKIGTIEKNTDIGIFGQIFSDTQISGEKVKIGYKQEVKKGKAQILMQLEGKVEYYDIEITDIYSSQQDTNKSFQIQVTDPELLAKTGGIVQGMSGSPILQDGKLIGAVTHVFVQDSSKGYGIFIENMLE
ncbi:MAG TPA: SpoIVB peptidase [Candidatus Blautia ornithocaccae]|uniref:SpoIVB peptidase n=1 Tax=Blautia sp. An81 TaxID=1965659 RepID=UPI000B38CD1F|nr:SpoIVB peptidase [Blautia sp. An81]OUN31867.1 SpoIVB peptidase [Blautia sp. An81]HJD36913.1 SpoIVB peptidase [Candidatus Blautia ornithocaccae]